MRDMLERALSGLALVLFSPALAVIALAILIEDGAPVLFRQTRVGRGGRPFPLLKFRSMRKSSEGALLTASGDRRITRVGGVIRKLKLDEVPQLLNVFAGEMSLIGPRPEVPQYVDLANPLWASVLRCKPGITCVSSLLYRSEGELLAASPDPQALYVSTILPDKLALADWYRRTRTVWTDLWLVLLTVRYSLLPSSFNAEQLRSVLTDRSQTK